MKDICNLIWLTFDDQPLLSITQLLYGFPFLEKCINFSVKSIGVGGEMWGEEGEGANIGFPSQYQPTPPGFDID